MRLTDTLERAQWVERRIRAMGSPAVLIAGDAPDSAIDWAIAELERLEQCWSRFRPDSELSTLNASPGSWFEPSATLAGAIDRALRLHDLTGGLFDPTIHDRLVACGYDRSFRELDLDQPGPVPAREPSPGPGGIERAGGAIKLPRGTRLDLGGIGKGLAADMIAVGLVAQGARSACVSLGGDIRVAGAVPTAGGWSIPVADPHHHDQILGHVPLVNAAIVTSTTAFRAWSRGGQAMHHLIDPRSGVPATADVRAVVATAPEAWLAEGYAKAALIAGAVAGRRLLDGAGLAGWVIAENGTCQASEWAPTMSAPPAGGAADEREGAVEG